MEENKPRLAPETLTLAKAGTQRPAYDRSRLRTGIVHLGLGAFARAHQALYTEELDAPEINDWGVTGVSLQCHDQRDRLMPQAGLYTALQKDRTSVSARIASTRSWWPQRILSRWWRRWPIPA
jgi:fructuronate reductase